VFSDVLNDAPFVKTPLKETLFLGKVLNDIKINFFGHFLTTVLVSLLSISDDGRENNK